VTDSGKLTAFRAKKFRRRGAVAGRHFRGHFERPGVERRDFVREPIGDVKTVAVGAGFDSFRVVAGGNPVHRLERRNIEDRTVPPYWPVEKPRPFAIRGMGPRSLRVDGHAKRMRAGLDRAFAGKSIRVDNRDLIVVAISAPSGVKAPTQLPECDRG